MAEPQGLHSKMKRVESLVIALEGCPDPTTREQARELVATLLEFHETALAKLLELIGGQGSMMESLGKDPIVGSLLLLYGLHPLDLAERVSAALDQVRPALMSHHGDVELIEVKDGRVQLRLHGTCHGCPASATTFRNLIEGAIRERAPEIEVIAVEGLIS